MPISAHVKKFWHRKLALLADDPDRYHLGYDIVPVMVSPSPLALPRPAKDLADPFA